MDEKKQNDALLRNAQVTMADPFNLPLIPKWTGYTAANKTEPAMYSLQGKWYKEGQVVNDGYTVGKYDDKTGQLNLMYKGIPLPIKMANSVVLPYTPPAPQTITMIGGRPYIRQPDGDLLNTDTGEIVKGEFENDLEKMHKAHDFSPEEMKNIIVNTSLSPFMRNFQPNKIMTRDMFQKAVRDGSVIPDSPYYIPRRQENGGVDFDVYTAPKIISPQ